MKRVSFLCALMALVGCRAAEPTAGSFDEFRVGSIVEPGLVRSTDSDLAHARRRCAGHAW